MRKILVLLCFFYFFVLNSFGQVFDTVFDLHKTSIKSVKEYCKIFIRSINTNGTYCETVFFANPLNDVVYLNNSYKSLFKKDRIALVKFFSDLSGPKAGYQHFIVIANEHAYIINMKNSLSDILIGLGTIPNIPMTTVFEYENILRNTHQQNWMSESDIKSPYNPSGW